MQTGHWLNVNRHVTLTSQLLGLSLVATVVVPALVIVGITGTMISIFK
jgi:hypothetical protein